MGSGATMMMASVTTSDIAKALCNMEVSTHFSFSTIVLVQYAEKSSLQMKISEKKNAMPQLMTMASRVPENMLNIGADCLVKMRRYRRRKLAFTSPSAGIWRISIGQIAFAVSVCAACEGMFILNWRLASPRPYLGSAPDTLTA